MTGLHPETRRVLEAVREAIAIPYAATAGGDEIRRPILDARISALRTSLDGALGLLAPASPGLDWELAHLRGELAKHPATGYRTWDESTTGRRAAEAPENGTAPGEGGQ